MQLVKPGGFVACLSFHSGEDRIVKVAFKELVAAGRGELVTRKPLSASMNEQRSNRPKPQCTASCAEGAPMKSGFLILARKRQAAWLSRRRRGGSSGACRLYVCFVRAQGVWRRICTRTVRSSVCEPSSGVFMQSTQIFSTSFAKFRELGQHRAGAVFEMNAVCPSRLQQWRDAPLMQRSRRPGASARCFASFGSACACWSLCVGCRWHARRVQNSNGSSVQSD